MYTKFQPLGYTDGGGVGFVAGGVKGEGEEGALGEGECAGFSGVKGAGACGDLLSDGEGGKSVHYSFVKLFAVVHRQLFSSSDRMML